MLIDLFLSHDVPSGSDIAPCIHDAAARKNITICQVLKSHLKSRLLKSSAANNCLTLLTN